MCRRLAIAALVVALGLTVSTACAQCGCSYAPSYTVGYAPSVAYYAPAEPYVTYYAPAASCASCAAPAAPSCTSCCAAAPAYTAYYAPAYTYSAYYPPAYTYSAYYAPAYVGYYGRPGWSVYGTPKVYVPGEPVRNVVRAITW
jgi:hypothetical protein